MSRLTTRPLVGGADASIVLKEVLLMLVGFRPFQVVLPWFTKVQHKISSSFAIRAAWSEITLNPKCILLTPKPYTVQ